MTDARRAPRLRRRWKAALWLAVAAILAYGAHAWYTVAYPTHAFRYELTAEVETPNGLRTGSSVIEVRYAFRFLHQLLIGGVSVGVWGEAVFVDLGQGRNLVLPLGGHGWRAPSAKWLPYELFADREAGDHPEVAASLEKAKSAGPRTLTTDQMPRAATFPDVNDQSSVRIVLMSDLEATYGPGYALRRVVAEPTTDPLTNTITDRLPWILEAEKPRPLPKPPAQPPQAPYGLVWVYFKSQGNGL